MGGVNPWPLDARIKPRILVEYLGIYTETHNIAYGIVAYSFVTRYSCLEFNCVFLKYMFHCFDTQDSASNRKSHEIGESAISPSQSIICNCTDVRVLVLVP